MSAPLPTADEPTSIDLYKDGTRECDKISFDLITLKYETHYPFWYWQLIKTIRRKYGLDVATYFNAYVSQETEAVDEALEEIFEESKVHLKPNLDRLCRGVLQNFVQLSRSISMKSHSGLDAFVQFHADLCNMDFFCHVEFLQTWSVVFKPCTLEDIGKMLEHEAMLFEIPFDERALLRTLCCPEIRNPKALVEIHWRQFLVDHVDIRKRLFLANESEELRCFDFEEYITFPE